MFFVHTDVRMCLACAIEVLREGRQRKKTLVKQKTPQLPLRSGNQSERGEDVGGNKEEEALSQPIPVVEIRESGLHTASRGRVVVDLSFTSMKAAFVGAVPELWERAWVKKTRRRIRRGSGSLRRVARREAAARLRDSGFLAPGARLAADPLATSGGFVTPSNTDNQIGPLAVDRRPPVPFIPFMTSGLTTPFVRSLPAPILGEGEGYLRRTEHVRRRQVGEGTSSSPLRTEPVRYTRTEGLLPVPSAQWEASHVDEDDGGVVMSLRRRGAIRARNVPRGGRGSTAPVRGVPQSSSSTRPPGLSLRLQAEWDRDHPGSNPGLGGVFVNGRSEELSRRGRGRGRAARRGVSRGRG